MSRRARAARSFDVLGCSVEEMTRLFGHPRSGVDHTVTWIDGPEEATAVRLDCFVPEGSVETARIVLPSPRRLQGADLLRWVGRYNGGHVRGPAYAPHSFGGGAPAVRFDAGRWALPQRDELGLTYGIKIWKERPDESEGA